MYVGFAIFDDTGVIVDEQNIPLGNFVLNSLQDVANADQLAILQYTAQQSLPITGQDILNLPGVQIVT